MNDNLERLAAEIHASIKGMLGDAQKLKDERDAYKDAHATAITTIVQLREHFGALEHEPLHMFIGRVKPIFDTIKTQECAQKLSPDQRGPYTAAEYSLALDAAFNAQNYCRSLWGAARGHPDWRRAHDAFVAGYIFRGPNLALSKAATDVITERTRQREKEGFDAEHDDQHKENELARAAICYADQAVSRSWVDGKEYRTDKVPYEWPDKWLRSWWKPTTPRRDLVKAAALIIAQIDRLDADEETTK